MLSDDLSTTVSALQQTTGQAKLDLQHIRDNQDAYQYHPDQLLFVENRLAVIETMTRDLDDMRSALDTGKE